MLDTSELPTSGRPSYELSQWGDVRRTMFDAPEPPPTSERRGHFPTHDADPIANAQDRAGGKECCLMGVFRVPCSG